MTPGQDGAGVIDALGAGVPGLAAGDRVWLYLGQHGLPYGTAAEYCVLDWHRAVRLPDSLPGGLRPRRLPRRPRDHRAPGADLRPPCLPAGPGFAGRAARARAGRRGRGRQRRHPARRLVRGDGDHHGQQ